MGKVFEDYFAELQSDIVALALEYAGKEIDFIYIYGSMESNITSFNIFLSKNNCIFHTNNLNSYIEKKMDTTDNMTFHFLKLGVQDLKKIKQICKEYDREMPTEIKLIYNVKNNSLSGEYNYDLKFSNSETLTARDIFLEWFEEVKKENGHDLG